MACCDGSGKGGYTRARLYMLKNDNPLAVSLGTHHNLSIFIVVLTLGRLVSVFKNFFVFSRGILSSRVIQF
jgi:hypothetical protein